MDKKRLCKRCASSLSEMDPHTICKSCRQPDPQMFYCSEEDCEACSVIKVYKPLDRFLRKQELENLTKKLNNFSVHQVKHDKPVHIKKTPQLFNKSHANFASAFEEKSQGINSEIMSTIFKGLYKEKGDGPHPSTSGTRNEGENFQDLEKRLFNKIMSNVMTTLSSDSKPSSFDGYSTSLKVNPSTSPKKGKTFPVKPYQPLIPPSNSNSNSNSDLNKEEEDFQDLLISLFKEVNPDSLAKANKGLDEKGKSDYVFKISSTASNILLNGTVLNSPSQATKLCKELDIENEISFWPSNLNAAEILHSNFAMLPPMKLHPKVRHMHTVLFGKLNPSLPQDLLGQDFTLPTISLELKNECLFAREQLQRLILMFSMADYFTGSKMVEENTSFNKLLELLLNQLKTAIENQANFVGLLIQEIRRDLLSDADCKEPEAISKLIMGPVHQSHFFGSYVKELQEIVNERGSSYCLTSKSKNANVNLFKLPSKFKEGESATKFLSNLRVFFESNATNDRDKSSIFENLLPQSYVDRLVSFVKPLKLTETSFEEVALTFEKFDQNNCANFLLERHSFSKIKQSQGQSMESYADFLETLIKRCMYGTSGREILRDQFVFGLKDENIKQYLLNKFSWTFEECITYAVKMEGNENVKETKPQTKRKFEANEEVNPKRAKVGTVPEVIPSKKVKVGTTVPDVKNVTKFYNSSNDKTKVLNVSSLPQWNEKFGFDVKYSFNVYCPWTGQILRS